MPLYGEADRPTKEGQEKEIKSLENIDLNTLNNRQLLKSLVELQIETNKYLKKIYNPK
jgi:hypothetical protein